MAVRPVLHLLLPAKPARDDRSGDQDSDLLRRRLTPVPVLPETPDHVPDRDRHPALTVRAALVITAYIGVLWSLLGVIFAQTATDFAVGAIVAAVAVIGIGLMDWMRR